jgi:hypothetical protein
LVVIAGTTLVRLGHDRVRLELVLQLRGVEVRVFLAEVNVADTVLLQLDVVFGRHGQLRLSIFHLLGEDVVGGVFEWISAR